MANDRSNYGLIKVAVEKGLRDMNDNLARGIRNLTDLGEQFSRGRTQKKIFRAASKELRNRKSKYYPLVKKVISTVNHKHLVRFGINLGYNCWAQGSGLVRDAEKRAGHHVPWCVVHNLEGTGVADRFLFESMIRQARDWGVRCHIIFVEHKSNIDNLVSAMKGAEDCAFLLILNSSDVTEDLARQIVDAKTVWTIIDMDEPGAETAAEILLRQQCLRGAMTRYYGPEFDISEHFSRAEQLDMPFLFVLPADGASMKREADLDLSELRENMRQPVFPVFLAKDILMIDHVISNEECGACIPILFGSGKVSILSDDFKITDCDSVFGVMEFSEILSGIMPKI